MASIPKQSRTDQSRWLPGTDALTAAAITAQTAQKIQEWMHKKNQEKYQKALTEESQWVDRQKIKLKSHQENIKRHQLNIQRAEEQGNFDLANRLRIDLNKIENQFRQERKTIADTMFTGQSRASQLATGEAQRFQNLQGAVGSTPNISQAMTAGLGGGHGAWGQIFNTAANRKAAGLQQDYSKMNMLKAEMGRLQDINKLDYEGMSDLGLVDIKEKTMADALGREGTLAGDIFKKKVGVKKDDTQQALTEGEALYTIPETTIIEPQGPGSTFGDMANIFANLGSLKRAGRIG